MDASGLLDRVRHYALPNADLECRGTWLRQLGEMRFAPDRPWMPFTAEQWFLGNGIDFRWRAWVRMAPLINARVIDLFEAHTGKLTAMLFGFIPVARARGPAADKGEAMRGLAELPWRPFAFRDDSHFRWEAIDNHKLRATFAGGATQVSIVFDIDSDGRVLGGTSPSRPRIVGKSVVETGWSGTFGEYKLLDGVRVPTVAEVSWLLPEGPFTYWRGRVTGFRILR